MQYHKTKPEGDQTPTVVLDSFNNDPTIIYNCKSLPQHETNQTLQSSTNDISDPLQGDLAGELQHLNDLTAKLYRIMHESAVNKHYSTNNPSNMEPYNPCKEDPATN